MSSEDLDPIVRVQYGKGLVSEYTYPIKFTEWGDIMWSQREDQRLMNSYTKIPREKIMILFPGRTWRAIVWRAYWLRIPRPGMHYTPEEDRLLVELYHSKELTYRQMVPYFMNRNRHSLKSRMHRIRRRRGGA